MNFAEGFPSQIVEYVHRNGCNKQAKPVAKEVFRTHRSISQNGFELLNGQFALCSLTVQAVIQIDRQSCRDFFIRAVFDQRCSLAYAVRLSPEANFLLGHICLNIPKIDFVVLQILLKSVVEIARLCPARRLVGLNLPYESMNRAFSVEIASWPGDKQRSIKEQLVDEFERDVMQQFIISGLYDLVKQLRFQIVLQGLIAAESAEKGCFVLIANTDQLIGVKASVTSDKDWCIRELCSDSPEDVSQATLKKSSAVSGSWRILDVHRFSVEKHKKGKITV